MKKIDVYSGAIGLFIVLVFQAGDLVAQDNEDAKSIRALRAESNSAVAAHDVAAIVSFLDEEYVITISTGAIEHSREEQAESWAQHVAQFPDVVYIRTPSEIDISKAYPLAMESGTWVGSMTTEHGRLEKSGKYSASWRKVDGVWKIRSEMFVALFCEGVDC